MLLYVLFGLGEVLLNMANRIFDKKNVILLKVKGNIKPGSYSFFVQQLENDFIRENLSILVEFGIPSNAVRRLENIIPANLSEDEVIDFIKKNRSNIKKKLLPYESERLEQCI